MKHAPSSKCSDLREIRTRLLERSDSWGNEILLTIDRSLNNCDDIIRLIL